MIIKCPECQSTISDQALQCPMCGMPLRSQAIEQTRKPFKLAVLVGSLAAIGSAILLIGSGNPSWVPIIFLSILIFLYGRIGAWWHNG